MLGSKWTFGRGVFERMLLFEVMSESATASPIGIATETAEYSLSPIRQSTGQWKTN